jgi:hypothetical protein
MYKKGGYSKKKSELGEIIIALRDKQLGPAYLLMANFAETIADIEEVLKQLVVEFKKEAELAAAAATDDDDAL